jgi:hypothetical protein
MYSLFDPITAFSPDVELLEADGPKITAYRVILAARSKFFQALFYGDFSEGTSPAGNSPVKLEFDGNSLRLIVEYCYTDHGGMLDHNNCAREMVPILLELASCCCRLFLLARTFEESEQMVGINSKWLRITRLYGTSWLLQTDLQTRQQYITMRGLSFEISVLSTSPALSVMQRQPFICFAVRCSSLCLQISIL